MKLGFTRANKFLRKNLELFHNCAGTNEIKDATQLKQAKLAYIKTIKGSVLKNGKTEIRMPLAIASAPAKTAKPRTLGAGAWRSHSGIRRSCMSFALLAKTQHLQFLRHASFPVATSCRFCAYLL